MQSKQQLKFASSALNLTSSMKVGDEVKYKKSQYDKSKGNETKYEKHIAIGPNLLNHGNKSCAKHL